MNEIKSKIKSILTRLCEGDVAACVLSGEIDLTVDEVYQIWYDERLAARARGYELGYADAQMDIEAHAQSSSRTHSAIVSNALVQHFYKR
jgi:hypothetical protein